jgi:hypothetical protein
MFGDYSYQIISVNFRHISANNFQSSQQFLDGFLAKFIIIGGKEK